MRPTYLEVNLSQLRNNLEAIRSHVAPAKVMPMVKANAYGHGVDGIAPFMEPYVDYFGVALVEEAIHLRQLGITKPILVAGGTLPAQIPLFLEHDLILSASSPELLAAAEIAAETAKKKLTAHLKIDTGMERVGVHEYEAEPFLEQSLQCKHVLIEGIYTHLANSEDSQLTHARQQLERFQEVLTFYEKRSLPTPIRHMANSGAVLQFPESHMDMVRPGVMFYGIYPVGVEHTVEIAPVLKWRSQVAFSKVTLPGRPVSYGSLWQSEVSTRIITIPCGYADGYFRRMTNQAQVVVHGKKYPQVGRICMDQFMVNLGDDQAQVGDEVVLLGDGITAYDLANWAGTNEYEVLTNISARVPRLYRT
ncbi:MAG TPA: alanine racemase [Anaerolineales bacterium]|nr:alanine racemase [Anaerolineales bacterium]